VVGLDIPNVKRYGKRFYLADGRTDLPKKIRQWSKREFLKANDRGSSKSIINITDAELQSYIAIAPVFQASLIKMPDTSIDNAFKIIFEPYRNSVTDNILFDHGVAINVYKAALTGIPDLSVNTYSYPTNVDSEKLNAIYNTNGEQSNILYFYYNDLAHGVISALNMDNGFSLVDHVRDTVFTPKQREEVSISDAINNTLKCVNVAMNMVMGTYSMHKDEIDNLISIVTHKKIDSKSQADSLYKLLKFNNPIPTYTIDPMIIDTLFVLEHSDKIDLDQLKNDNRLYTIMIVRVREGIEGKAYVVMYREPPIELRQESNTGFSKEELSKLLR
jgi:hypothetical protein